ncbi:MAG: FG-GAP repeat domain-containing protein, partial [Gammaproteobacteria bacterium]
MSRATRRAVASIQRLGLGCVLLSFAACTPEAPSVTQAPAPATDRVAPAFAERAAETELIFEHFSGTTGDYLFAEILGSGVALLDYDADGDLDVYLVQGQLFDASKSIDDALFPPPAEQSPGNRLFQNQLVQTGTLTFVDVTERAGVGHTAYGMGVATGDIDNDGDIDMYVTNYGDNVLYRNNGDGTFSDVTRAANANAPNWSMSASFFDLENDGDLDLYVVAYVNYSLDIDIRCTSANGNRDYCGPQNYQNARDYLLRNDGRGNFEDVSDAFGVADVRGPGLGVTAADFNLDGFTDLFVANDGEANFVWMNDAGQRFEEMGLMSGTAYNRDGSPEASMGVSAGDFDGDGDEDLFMTHLINETNTLYVNDGEANFDDITDRFGLGAGSKAYTGFGTAWFDYNNDGWLDLYIVNGDVKIEEQRASSGTYAFDQPNQLFRNAAGKRFDEIRVADDPATALSDISRGVAFGDIDNNGSTDMVVSNNSGSARLLINRVPSDNAWVGLRLVGSQSPRSADGARVAITDKAGVTRWRR